tara:strand:- start:323 stop:1468 length:1146 start_codon:yes stop_codon:yes gene_type:complete
MLTLQNEVEAKPAAHHDIQDVIDQMQRTRKHDFACPRNKLSLRWRSKEDAPTDRWAGYSVTLDGGDKGYEFTANDHFIGQMSSYWTGMKPYGRMLNETGQNELLVHNINKQLSRTEGGALIRTTATPTDGGSYNTARAFLSDRYKIVDDNDVFDVALPIIGEHSDTFRSLGGRRTDTNTHTKFITREPIAQIGKREMFAGFELSNSEVGLGSASFKAIFFDNFCENGCTFGNIKLFQASFVHKGAKLQTDFGPVFGDEFKLAETAAVRSCIAEATRRALDTKYHDQIAEIIERGHKRKVTGDVATVLKEVGKRVGLTETEREQSLLMMDESEAHAYGVQAAITKLAQDASSYTRRSKLEEAGGKVLELTDSAWNAVASLAA